MTVVKSIAIDRAHVLVGSCGGGFCRVQLTKTMSTWMTTLTATSSGQTDPKFRRTFLTWSARSCLLVGHPRLSRSHTHRCNEQAPSRSPL